MSFICKEDRCVHTMEFYCQICQSTRHSKYNHSSHTKLIDKLEMLESKWRQIEGPGGDMIRVVKEAEKRFRELSPVIRYLEGEIFRLATLSSIGYQA